MIKVILFDFDGTLANSFESFLGIVEKMTTKYNLQKIDSTDLMKFRDEDARSLVKNLKVPFYKLPFIARDMKKLQSEDISNIKAFASLAEALKNIKKLGVKLGILTSNGRANVEVFLENNGLSEEFDYIYSDASVFGKDKVINKFLKQQKINKDEVIYVGDEIRDIQACKKVGIKMIAVTWGFNSKAGLVKNNPDYIADNLNDLVRLIRTV